MESGNRQVGREGQVTGTGGKGVIVGQQRLAGCGSQKGEKARGHLVDR